MQKTDVKKQYVMSVIISFLCTLVVVLGAFRLFSGGRRPDASMRNFSEAGITPPYSEYQTIALKHEAAQDVLLKEFRIPQDLSISSPNAVLMRAADGSVLFEKSSDARIYPASMTKIMTAVVALENLSDLGESIILHENIFPALYQANASIAGFMEGEYVNAIDLLYGLMLPSGAECAIGLARHAAGDERAFVDLMNEKAYELGMTDTHFTNTTGLHDADHYSTARDIGVLLQYAIGNDTFYEIFTSVRHTTPPTNKHEAGVTCYSTLFANISSAGFEGGSILGGKTGYTENAGQCLASLAEKCGERFILITCGARPGSTEYGMPGGDKPHEATHYESISQNMHIRDAFTVYDSITEVE